MLKLPMHGFAKRVDDVVTRAESILQARQHVLFKGQSPANPPNLKKPDQHDKPK
ncbi:hypothetical protein [Microvirga sp. Mcv34]|uniref:hypothetical protein n=1 Tax=Microvirga sp. Mcv34 TaxID=2926016 RepID=UPI0021CADF89|nr:hypothetical protein [Microvirga sp. Mcv34]